MPGRSRSIDRCVKALARSRSVVVSTGAGISKESGIPTFRDAPNALWANFDPETLATPEGFRQNPSLVWRWYGERRNMISDATPNKGHEALAEMESMFEEFMLVTQNIDNLHRQAGSVNLIEIHGNIFRYKCLDVGHPIDELPDDDHEPPHCECGSMIRPDIVWFGEMLPEEGLDRAMRALQTCDTALIVGTSGTVHPAAGFASVAKEAGATLIEVNPEETPITEIADIFVQSTSAKALEQIVRSLKETRKK